MRKQPVRLGLQLLALLLVLFSSFTLHAGNNRWTPTAFSGACCGGFVFSPSERNLVFGLSGDLWRSRDAGGSWQRLFLTKLPFVHVKDAHGFLVRIHPLQPDRIIVLLNVLMASDDQGKTWSKIAELPPGRFGDMEFNPLNPKTLYLDGTDAVYKTIDLGKTWQRILKHNNPVYYPAFEVDPFDNRTLYSLEVKRIQKSTDAGATWSMYNAGFPNGGGHLLKADPLVRGTLYAGLGGIYKSTDGGVHWFNTLCQCVASDLAVSSLHPGTLVASTFGYTSVKSTDGASHWQSLTLPNVNSNGAFHVATSALDDSLILMSNLYGQVFRSTDGGVTWTITIRGAAHDLPAFDLNSSPDQLLVKAETLFRSSDAGKNWEALNQGFPGHSFSVLDVQSHPSNSGLIALVGIDNERLNQSDRTFFGISTDHGTTWHFQNTYTSARSIAFDPGDPNRIYLGLRGAVARSTDQGNSWQILARGFSGRPIFTLLVDPRKTSNLFAGTYFDLIYRSTDAGTTWSRSTGLAHGENGTYISALAMDPASHSILYASSTHHGLYKSTDAGSTWIPIATNIFRTSTGDTRYFAYFVRSVQGNPAAVFAGGDPNDLLNPDSQMGLFVSQDQGRTWNRFDTTAAMPVPAGILDFHADLVPALTYLISTRTGIFTYTPR